MSVENPSIRLKLGLKPKRSAGSNFSPVTRAKSGGWTGKILACGWQESRDLHGWANLLGLAISTAKSHSTAHKWSITIPSWVEQEFIKKLLGYKMPRSWCHPTICWVSSWTNAAIANQVLLPSLRRSLRSSLKPCVQCKPPKRNFHRFTAPSRYVFCVFRL